MSEVKKLSPLERAIRNAYPLTREITIGGETFVLQQPSGHSVRTLLYDLEEKYPLTAQHNPAGEAGSTFKSLPHGKQLEVKRQWKDYLRENSIGMARLCLGPQADEVPDDMLEMLIEGHDEFDATVADLCGSSREDPPPAKDDPNPFASPESTG